MGVDVEDVRGERQCAVAKIEWATNLLALIIKGRKATVLFISCTHIKKH